MSLSPSVKALHSFVALISKTAGRDKMCRLVQYFTQFISERAAEQATADSLVTSKKWLRLSKQMRSVRKVLRFLRSMEYSRKIMDLAKNFKKNRTDLEKFHSVMSMLSALFTILFFVTDHRVFLAEIGVISKDNLQKNFTASFKWWRLECIFSILADIAQLCIIKDRGTEDEERANELALDILKNIFDAMIAYSTLNKGSGLTTKNIGLLGTVTSLIGIYQLWK